MVVVVVVLLVHQALELGAIPIMVRTADEQKNFMNCKPVVCMCVCVCGRCLSTCLLVYRSMV